MRVAILPARRSDIVDVVMRSPEGTRDDRTVRVVEDWYFQSVECWAGLADDKIACMWGLMKPSLMSDRPAYLWLVTTDLVDEYKFTFIRHSQLAVEEMLKDFPVIVGHCLVSQPAAVRWLRWLGATFGDEVQGADGTWFLPFELRGKHG